MYAIYNKIRKKFVYGTDYRHYYKEHDTFAQRLSKNKMITFATLDDAVANFRNRKCGKDYVIVVLKTVEIKRIVDERHYR